MNQLTDAASGERPHNDFTPRAVKRIFSLPLLVGDTDLKLGYSETRVTSSDNPV